MAGAASAASAAAARISGALSDAQYFESGMVRVEDIRRLLDSRSLKDKLDAMKRVVALISLGRDASIFFPDVVKNVVAPSLDVKKLVYLYLVHYAEDKQDLALLSINSFQKDISDHNELIRALALRVLSSIRVKVILQVVILAINKCAKDPSPYVRKAAAHAICKVCSLDNPSREELMEPLSLLLNDRSLEVLGSAVAVLHEIAPDNFDAIHAHYRHICRFLPDMDPRGQVAVLRVLLRYGRTQFVGSSAESNEGATSSGKRDDDLTLLLAAVCPLLMSHDASVVMAAISIYVHLASREEVVRFVTMPLLRLSLSSDPGVQYVALRVATRFSEIAPGALLTHLAEFFVWDIDGAPVRDAKLAVLAQFCEQAAEPGGLGSNIQARNLLLSEFKSYMFRTDKTLAAAATRAMGQLAAAHPPSTAAIIGLLGSVVAKSNDVIVVSESVTVLRRLLQLHPESQARALPRLVSLLLIPAHEDAAIAAPEARAAIVWLIGEFYAKIPHVAPEALRTLAVGFRTERAEVKLQILSLATKVVAWEKLGNSDGTGHFVSAETRQKLLSYVTSCALVDVDYDVRDKARMLRHLFLSDVGDTFTPQLYEVILNGMKQSEFHGGKGVGRGGLVSTRTSVLLNGSDASTVISSFSHVLGRSLDGCQSLPAWAAHASASSLRDEDPAVLRTGGGPVELASISSASYRGGALPAPALGSVSDRFPGRPEPRPVANPLSRFGTGVTLSGENFYDSDSASTSSEGSYESSSAESADQASVIEDTPTDITLDSLGILPVGSRESQKDSVEDAKSRTSTDIFAVLAAKTANRSNSQNIGGSGENFSRAWRSVIESWNSGGVEVGVFFSPGGVAGGPDATPMVFRVANCGKVELKDVSLRSDLLTFHPENAKCCQFGSLPSGEDLEAQAYGYFAGKPAPVGIEVHIGDKLMGRGEVRPTPGQVLRPMPSITLADYSAKEKSLRGMLGCSLSFSIPDGSALGSTEALKLSSIRSRILNAALLAEIVGSQATSELNSAKRLRFAGFLPGAKGDAARRNDVLVGVELKECETLSVLEGSVWVGCENVVYANTLAHLLKSALLTDVSS